VHGVDVTEGVAVRVAGTRVRVELAVAVSAGDVGVLVGVFVGDKVEVLIGVALRVAVPDGC
jgi:hypothetical protein